MQLTTTLPNGTIFLEYILKSNQEFTCNLDYEDGRSDRILRKIFPAGTKVQINLSATLSGNYAEFVTRFDNYTYRMNLEVDYADRLVDKYASRFNQRKPIKY